MKIKMILELGDGTKIKLTEAKARELHSCLDRMYGTPTYYSHYNRPWYYGQTPVIGDGITTTSTSVDMTEYKSLIDNVSVYNTGGSKESVELAPDNDTVVTFSI